MWVVADLQRMHAGALVASHTPSDDKIYITWILADPRILSDTEV